MKPTITIICDGLYRVQFGDRLFIAYGYSSALAWLISQGCNDIPCLN